ncbi:helix-turn-helix domain-containing protein [Salmonella enterica subsp. houtenae serovar 44:z36,[z38]:-]|nr:helix-turn-helix domain-containing protein [Salmonella enterica subsp. houtenae serovar 44:z36,[z38]:-]
MSDKELSRINVIQSVIEKRMRRRDAAHQLALTERQTQRLMNRFRESGAAGLANLRRGRPGNHRLPESLKLRVLSLLHEHYSDFGPTLAAEKLRERHDITVSVETLIKWMTADGLNGGSTTTGVTQFGRVLSELGIELICANSPQAKGRVERANQTLQDRLIKEMRLEGISSIEAANAWLNTFIADFNRRFARPSKYPKNLHRPVAESNEELDDIFAWQESRKISKTLTFRYDKMIYLVEPTEENTRIAGERITVYDYPDGTLAFKYGYRSLKYQVFDKLECVDQGQVVDNKRLGAVLKLAQSKMDELERDGKRGRSKKMPKRRAQAQVQEQLRAINPVLLNPEEFRASLKR